jgi:hypothetical protein
MSSHDWSKHVQVHTRWRSGYSIMLQAVLLWVRDPVRRMKFFFNLPNPSSRTTALGFIQPLIEMSTGSRKIMFLGRGRGRRCG